VSSDASIDELTQMDFFGHCYPKLFCLIWSKNH